MQLIIYSCLFISYPLLLKASSVQNTPTPTQTPTFGTNAVGWITVDKSNSTNTIPSNVELTCNSPRIDEVTTFITTKRFDFRITQQMKSYGSIFIDTCSVYRGNYSLNTNMKIKNVITQQTLQQNDNIYGAFKSVRCNDYESIIDITDLDIGSYIVEVSASTLSTNGNIEFHQFSITLECSLESIDTQTTQLLDINNVIGNISCSESLYYQSNITNPLTSIAYYTFTVNDDTERPIVISTCDEIGINNNNNNNGNNTEYYQPDTYLYLLQKHPTPKTEIYTIIQKNDNNMKCNIGAILEAEELPNGEYIIAIGEHFPYDYSHYGRIKISMQCGDSKTEQFKYVFNDTPSNVFWFIFVTIPLILTVLVMIFWVYQTEKFKKKRKDIAGNNKNIKYHSCPSIKEYQLYNMNSPYYNGLYKKRSCRDSPESESKTSNDSNGVNTAFDPQINNRKLVFIQNEVAFVTEEDSENMDEHKHDETETSVLSICKTSLSKPVVVDSEMDDEEKELKYMDIELIAADFPKRQTTKNMMKVIVPQISDPPKKAQKKESTVSINSAKRSEYKDKIRNIVFDIIESCRNENDLDIYQVLAFRKLDKYSHKLRLFKPFETVGIEYELLAIKSYYKAMFVAIITGILQTFGVFIIAYSAISTYFDNKHENEKWCHWTLKEWQRPWIFKVFACLWAIFITIRIGYHLKQLTYTGFTQCIEIIDNDYFKFYKIVSANIVQIGSIINLITLLVAVFGSYLVIYQVEAGFGATDLALNALAFFFMIELDNIVVTKRDYHDIQESMKDFIEDTYLKKKNNINDDENKSCCLIYTACFTKYFAFIIASITFISGIYAPWIILICTYHLS